MGTAIPFSEVDLYLKSLSDSKKCLVDSNFLIALSEEHHPFNEDAQFLYEKLAEYKVSIYCTVANRTEFIDFRRKMILTEALMEMQSPSSKWKISAAVRKELLSHKGWIDNQAKVDELPVLTDKKIKESKKAFLPKTQSGQIGWTELCKEYLSGNLLEAWSTLEEAIQLNYIDMRSDEISQLFNAPLEWAKMYSIAEDTGLGSSDAMLLNVLNSGVFSFIVSADYDIAFGVVQSKKDKSVFVPDGLFRRHLKNLRF